MPIVTVRFDHSRLDIMRVKGRASVEPRAGRVESVIMRAASEMRLRFVYAGGAIRTFNNAVLAFEVSRVE